jgi:hypothetical protein
MGILPDRYLDRRASSSPNKVFFFPLRNYLLALILYSLVFSDAQLSVLQQKPALITLPDEIGARPRLATLPRPTFPERLPTNIEQ